MEKLTCEPSTSTEMSPEVERSILLQQALSQAGVIRSQKLKAGNIRNRQNSGTCQKISDHPLMPIVQLLFMKCERAAHTLNKSHFDMEDVKELFQELESKGVQCNTEDVLIDELMKNAILALRTCLVEIQKVSTLSDSFKEKYLANLKRTVCQESLIGCNVDSDDELNEQMSDESRSNNAVESALATLQTVGGTLAIPLHITQQSITMIPSATQIERNVEFLRKLGYPGNLIAKLTETKSSETSPDKSEEEKHLLCDLAQ